MLGVGGARMTSCVPGRIGLLLDDELAADPRVATAKKIFAVSVGIPVLEPNTGQLHAVLMM
eukprot:919164-Rhodomonas_salina.1